MQVTIYRCQEHNKLGFTTALRGVKVGDKLPSGEHVKEILRVQEVESLEKALDLVREVEEET